VKFTPNSTNYFSGQINPANQQVRQAKLFISGQESILISKILMMQTFLRTVAGQHLV
jgi:hypothetical protein